MFKLSAAVSLAGILLLTACQTAPPERTAVPTLPEIATWDDVSSWPQPAAVAPLAYAPGKRQFGELRLPPGVPGPYPVAVIVHGDCWASPRGIDTVRPLAAALSELGVATWTVEYRQPASKGGSDAWVDAYRDVAHALDHLRVLAQTHALDLQRVATIGHGGGGAMALWLASRARIPEGDPLYIRNPLKIHAAIGLAAATDLLAADGNRCVAAMQGQASSLASVSPAALLPLGVPQWLIHGANDGEIPPQAIIDYVSAARESGDAAVLAISANAGHLEPILPAGATWLAVQQAVIDALHGS